MRNDPFMCQNCHQYVSEHPTGSARNHCPYCLCSLHVDRDFPGDRMSECHAIMEPFAIDQTKKGYIILQRCKKCGKENRNITAPDDDIVSFMREICHREGEGGSLKPLHEHQ